MTDWQRGTPSEEASDLAAFKARVKANEQAESAQPRGLPVEAERVEEYILHSWNEVTASCGVEAWMEERALVPIEKEDLTRLQSLGYPKDDRALVALGRAHGNNRLNVMDRRNGEVRIVEADRIYGADQDLWFIGDWRAGVIFPAKRVG